MLTKILIINTHTGTNLVLYVVKKESVYILVVLRRLLYTIVCTSYTIGYTYILLYEHTLTMVENTFVIQQVPID